MPPLLPRSILTSPTTRLLSSSIRIGSRPFSTHPSHRLGHPDGDAFYDPPTGWLFGVPPGEKYKKEGWENVWVYGYWGSCLLAVVAYIYKPDTSIQTWALEEARRRLEAEGILPDPDPERKE